MRGDTFTHGGDVWQSGQPEGWLDFSANLNPDGPPEWVCQAMSEGLRHARYYPDPRGTAARRGAAAHLGLPEACVMVTSGGMEAIAFTARLSGRHVIPQPTFQEYARVCGECVTLPRPALMEYRFSAGECLWLCNPNNPTGEALSRAAVLALLERAEAAGARLAVDEAFIHYCPEHSVADCVREHPALTVLGSLTKALAIPGIRLGYLAAHPSVIAEVSKNLPPWRVNCAAEAVAAALPRHGDGFTALRALNATRRAAFKAMLEGVGARVAPSEASFLLCDFGRDMRPVIEQLRARRVLVRSCGGFAGLTWGHVRLCVRTEDENARLVGLLAEIGGCNS